MGLIRSGRGRSLTSLSAAALTAAAVVVATPAHAAGGSLVADWEMNENGGSTMVDSAGNNNGSLHAITPNGSFYRFNGTSSIALAKQGFAIGSADLSFTARLRFAQVPSATVGDYDIVRGAPSGKWKLEIVRRNKGTTGKAQCRFAGTSTTAALVAGPSLADNAWHTITCTKTSRAISMTLDGTTYTKAVTVGSLDTTGKEVALGGQAAGADQFDGDLDYVKVFVG